MKFSIHFFIFLSSVLAATAQKTSKPNIQPNYIIIGTFCGMCDYKDISRMYKYNMLGNLRKLFVDTTHSFYTNSRRVECTKPITDSFKINAVEELVKKIPTLFLEDSIVERKFGCPDCWDGGGLYFEIGSSDSIKKFYIDTNTEKFDIDVKKFTELFIKTIKILIAKK